MSQSSARHAGRQTRAIAAPPPLDLTLADPAQTAHWAEQLGGESLMPGHVRLPGGHVPEMPGFEDGAWWIEFAPLSGPELVPRAAASALSVPESQDLSPTEALVEHLKSRKTLLILDNCEHLIEACAELPC